MAGYRHEQAIGGRAELRWHALEYAFKYGERSSSIARRYTVNVHAGGHTCDHAACEWSRCAGRNSAGR